MGKKKNANMMDKLLDLAADAARRVDSGTVIAPKKNATIDDVNLLMLNRALVCLDNIEILIKEEKQSPEAPQGDKLEALLKNVSSRLDKIEVLLKNVSSRLDKTEVLILEQSKQLQEDKAEKPATKKKARKKKS